MRDYEITYLADPQLDEAVKDKLDEAIDAAIAERAGHIVTSFPPTGAPGSRRRLHYPIARQRLTWLRTVQVKLDEAHAEALRGAIQKAPGVLRLTMLQTAPRPEVSAAMLDSLAEQARATAAPDVAQPAAPAVTMAEVEEKIEKALEEEVK